MDKPEEAAERDRQGKDQRGLNLQGGASEAVLWRRRHLGSRERGCLAPGHHPASRARRTGQR
ncbi:MAG TPA: hypothetical protein VJX68_01755 [Candidatus Binatus sp.]|uniref:hypothetical protein n=1 Tax=Candidatus Binatus sp. TaxID=2811406 RepID=UPI002B478337|nr:hypothetical protein [Candidatus Binatus sp.]HKN11896.1 hypothetical protein [Candidatus Binatus sp.]